MSRILLGALLFLFFISIDGANLKTKDWMSVWEPDALKLDLGEKAKNLDFKVGNFGNIPWGKTVLGNVTVPEDEEGCQPPSKEAIKAMAKRKNETKFILMKRGNCSFVQKAFNAQVLGANMVIFRNSDTSDVHQLEMVSDGSVSELDIPAIIIDKDEGKIIHDHARKYEKMSDEDKAKHVPPALSIYFHWAKSDNVHYDLWMSSSEETSMKFLRDFAGKIQNLSDFTTFTPHYVQLECFFCSITSYQTPVDNCVSGGRFCAIDPDGEGDLTGRDALMEDVRQICINRLYGDKIFLKYASKFYGTCLKDRKESSLKACSENLMEDKGISRKRIQACYEESWNKTRVEVVIDKDLKKTEKVVTDTDVNELLHDNNLLKKEMAKWKQRGGVWPMIVVNKIQFKGDLNPDRIFEALCRSFNKPPKDCNLPDFKEIPANPDAYRGGRKTFWKLFGLIIGGLIGVMTLFFFIYRRYVRRAMTEEMNEQINSAVSAYFRMGESSRLGKSQAA